MTTSVLVVDDDADLREVLGGSIELLGHGCVTAASLAELMEKREEAVRCKLAILDINLHADAPSGLDVHRWLEHEGFTGTILFLTGHARTHPLVIAACESGARVVEKPIGLKELRGLIDVEGQ
jgi:DNA-binding NtrC family response regulator